VNRVVDVLSEERVADILSEPPHALVVSDHDQAVIRSFARAEAAALIERRLPPAVTRPTTPIR
jgi:hypothetical protein